MRIGLFSLVGFCFLFFLLILNMGSFPVEKMDVLFESIDSNTFGNPDQNFIQDANLNKFIKYTGQGIVKEFQGTFYLASWANTWLPSWLVENRELLLVLCILVICAPVIAEILHFVVLILLAIVLWSWDKIKDYKKKKREKEVL